MEHMCAIELLALYDVAKADAALEIFGFFTVFSNTACHVLQAFELVDKLSPFIESDQA
jgi:hypothetical protein